jgi:hypothetical protein
MSDFEMDFGQQLLDIIATQIGENGIKDFIRDFAEWCEVVLDDPDYIEVEDSLSDSEEDDESESEVWGIEVEEEYETEVDEEGFYSLKDCVIKKK